MSLLCLLRCGAAHVSTSGCLPSSLLRSGVKCQKKWRCLYFALCNKLRKRMTGSTRGPVPVSGKLKCAPEEFQFNFNWKKTFAFWKCIHLNLTHPDVANITLTRRPQIQQENWLQCSSLFWSFRDKTKFKKQTKKKSYGKVYTGCVLFSFKIHKLNYNTYNRGNMKLALFKIFLVFFTQPVRVSASLSRLLFHSRFVSCLTFAFTSRDFKKKKKKKRRRRRRRRRSPHPSLPR